MLLALHTIKLTHFIFTDDAFPYERRRARLSAARASSNDTVKVSNHEECLDNHKNDNHAEEASTDDRYIATEGANERNQNENQENENIAEAVEAFQ